MLFGKICESTAFNCFYFIIKESTSVEQEAAGAESED